ncbi:dimethylarginine dimethylaminohydrolase family protein [Sphingomonas montanisoli]|nr:arginine deiminase family protein [Sphingomonas montanisoli]
MKLDFLTHGERGLAGLRLQRCHVSSETDRLTDVLLCQPTFLEPVPCCSVTQESLRDGFATSVPQALVQHRALQAALERAGVRCHFLEPDPAMPDMCFTRDALVTTPWGLFALNPAAGHRQAEAVHALKALRGIGAPLAACVQRGTAEGGDIAIVKPGLVIIGCSGERTNEDGAESVAEVFRGQGWDVIVYRFDQHFLHLDTQFAMVGDGLALACTDVLSDAFLADLARFGIETIAVSYKEARSLGCNMLSLGDRRLLASEDNDRVIAELRTRGYQVETLALDQFTRCGGGVHCLTMPLARVAA